jgi:hypothetical protein
MAPARGCSLATFTNPPRVPERTSASGLRSRMKGAVVDFIPWLAAAANPRFASLRISLISG